MLPSLLHLQDKGIGIRIKPFRKDSSRIATSSTKPSLLHFLPCGNGIFFMLFHWWFHRNVALNLDTLLKQRHWNRWRIHQMRPILYNCILYKTINDVHPPYSNGTIFILFINIPRIMFLFFTTF